MRRRKGIFFCCVERGERWMSCLAERCGRIEYNDRARACDGRSSGIVSGNINRILAKVQVKNNRISREDELETVVKSYFTDLSNRGVVESIAYVKRHCGVHRCDGGPDRC